MDSSTRMTVESYIGPGARNGNVLIYAKLNFCLWRRINVAVRNFVSSFGNFTLVFCRWRCHWRYHNFEFGVVSTRRVMTICVTLTIMCIISITAIFKLPPHQQP